MLPELLESKLYGLLQNDDEVKKAARAGVAQNLNPLAKNYTVLDAIHTDGLDAEQIWVQAQMVLEGTIDKLYDTLAQMQPANSLEEAESEAESELDSEAESALEDSELDDSQVFGAGNELAEEELEDEESEESEIEGHELQDDFDEADFLDDEAEEASEAGEESEASADKSGISGSESEESAVADDIAKLNTGLFNLEDFQQQVLALEDEEDEDEEEIDMFAELGSDDSDAGDAKFNDFFAPPVKKSKSHSKEHKKMSFAEEQEQEDELEDAMEAAQRDMFESDEDVEEDGNFGGEKLSKFEQQQLELQRQIEALETENVAEKDWALKGEVSANQRPKESLINTELDFERNAKPAPVITSETTESLEDLIRDRIKKDQFDDLRRRLASSDTKFEKSKVLDEVQQTKSSKSLADLYEEDQAKAENPEYYAKQATAHVDKAHEDVKQMFATLVRKLDSLSSWNYTPKAPQASIAIVTDAPSISMEDAQPSTMTSASALAPQEVYKAGQAKENGEIVGSSGLPIARSELTSEDRKRQRRRQKAKAKAESARKADADAARAETLANKHTNTNKKIHPKDKKAKESMFDTLKKGNVTMVDKKGQKRDMRGKIVKDSAPSTVSHIKL